MLRHAYPQSGRETAKDLWHISQFYALREKALAEGDIAEARRNQWHIRLIDVEVADKIGAPRLAGGNGAVHEMLPPAAEAQSEALDGALEKSRGGGKKDEPAGEEGE